MHGFLLGAWLVACSADAVSTHVALNTGKVVEMHLSQNPWVTDGLVGAQAVILAGLMGKLHRRHPKLTTGILVTATAIRVLAVANNIGVLRSIQ